MRRKFHISFIVLMFFLIITLSGCDFFDLGQDSLTDEQRVQTQVVGTVAAMQTIEVLVEEQVQTLPSESNIPVPTQTETIMPTITENATNTLTTTPEKVMVSVSVDTNCRSGPGRIYDYIGALLVGEEAEVVGKSVDGEYWVIKNPDRSGECWLWGYYASIVGDSSEVASYTPPPTPTPAFYWSGEWMLALGPIDGPPIMGFPLTITVEGKALYGNADLGGGENLIINGTISDDYLTVSGTWEGPTNNGTFEFFALGVNQFQGNYSSGTDTLAWCGNREGAGVPSPCYKD